MKLLVLEKAFNSRLRSVPVFPNSNIGCFFYLVHVHLTILSSDIPLDCIKARFRSVPVFPHSNIGYFQFRSCSFLRPIFHISDEVFGLFPNFLKQVLFRLFRYRLHPFRVFHTHILQCLPFPRISLFFKFTGTPLRVC